MPLGQIKDRQTKQTFHSKTSNRETCRDMGSISPSLLCKVPQMCLGVDFDIRHAIQFNQQNCALHYLCTQLEDVKPNFYLYALRRMTKSSMNLLAQKLLIKMMVKSIHGPK